MPPPWTAASAPSPSGAALLDLFAEAVEQVESWDDKAVEHGGHLVRVQGEAGAGTQVHEDECPVQHGHSREVEPQVEAARHRSRPSACGSQRGDEPVGHGNGRPRWLSGEATDGARGGVH